MVSGRSLIALPRVSFDVANNNPHVNLPTIPVADDHWIRTAFYLERPKVTRITHTIKRALVLRKLVKDEMVECNCSLLVTRFCLLLGLYRLPR